MLRAFSSRNFSLFYTGQAISLIGTSMTQVATSWLVYRLTDSALLLGVVGFASQIPTLLLIPLGRLVKLVYALKNITF
jgi:Transmembrane secretion effector